MASESSDHILSLLLAVLGQAEESSAVNQLLSILKGERPDEVPVERKVYPNITYLNHHAFGISLQLESSPSSAKGSEQVITAIDLYNHAPKAFETGGPAEASKREKKHEYVSFPIYPIRIGTFISSTTTDVKTSDKAPPPPPTGSLNITRSTSGSEFVQALGEPSRKGGGEGPIGRGPAAWMEWTGTLQSLPTASSSVPDTLSERQHYDPEAQDTFGGMAVQIMVELGGPGARGPRRWEADSAGQSVWKVLTFAVPSP
ncbi:unnamed protein product [Tilletia laevis]|uniref:Uncharacterized protein n=1 Tax=Tilletia controversa TaxID=13291 RepID=A0A8X7SZF7_9BASI|nr:hypothetical protein CF336_g8174 [Tilletia laevis]KAE8190803.1 hypothetical protein CF328_g5868 [Tilletia controversa]KAE8185374.1 hypothetical protein CF335_g7739 [Tilletia laevis]KAE8252957.1 hypothetical protein A4X06_0g1809 [Tilletia controversa]CAD6926817.1 unnamed protein product [Tilletia laevis]